MSVQLIENGASYHYTIGTGVPIADVRETLTLAVMAIECLHGRSRVQLDAFFTLDEGSRTCVVDAGTDVGRDIAGVFTGYLTNTFGERAFTVERRTDRAVKAS